MVRQVAMKSIGACLLAFGLTGCSYFATFTPRVKQDVSVVLKENDFTIVRTNLTGRAGVFQLFGFIPLGDERLFSRALADLYLGAERDVAGSPSQLINWTLDDTRTDYLIGRYDKVVFRADLMRFNK